MSSDEEILAELDEDFIELMAMVDDMSVSADEFGEALKKNFMKDVDDL